jgi:IclR family acetate operon transcriptional repressor
LPQDSHPSLPSRSRVKNRSGTESGPAYPIESVGNALALLLLYKDRHAIRVAEASDALGVARSTAHRLLAMLQHYGLVRQNPRTRAYHAGSALVELGAAVSAEVDVQAAVRPLLEKLVDELGETAHVCTLRGRDSIFLGCVESPKALRSGDRTGTALPAYATSAGKALLAALSDDAVRERFPNETLEPLTRRTIRTRSALLAELRRVRERGFATNVDESESGLWAFGCAIRGRSGEVRAAITVSGPGARFRDLDQNRVAAALQAACETAGAEIR